MFTLGRGMFQEFSRKDEFYILIVGIDDAGKTTYAESLKANFDKSFLRRHPSKIRSTVGLNLVKVDCGSIILNLWDVGGDRELRSLWTTYFDECRVIVFMIDISNNERWSESLECLDELLKVEQVSNKPLLILLNKCDKNLQFVDKAENDASSIDGDECCSQSTTKNVTETGGLLSNISAYEFERFRLKIHECLNTSPRQGEEFAILSVSALENSNVYKSALWILDVILGAIHR